eukprot:g51758.t1
MMMMMVVVVVVVREIKDEVQFGEHELLWQSENKMDQSSQESVYPQRVWTSYSQPPPSSRRPRSPSPCFYSQPLPAGNNQYSSQRRANGFDSNPRPRRRQRTPAYAEERTEEEEAACSRELSHEQEAILRFRPHPESKVLIAALPGTGKTFTTVRLIKHLLELDPHAKLAYLVFNKAARNDVLKSNPLLRSCVEVLTLHAFGKGRINAIEVTDRLPTPEQVAPCEVEALKIKSFRVHSSGQIRILSCSQPRLGKIVRALLM